MNLAWTVDVLSSTPPGVEKTMSLTVVHLADNFCCMSWIFLFCSAIVLFALRLAGTLAQSILSRLRQSRLRGRRFQNVLERSPEC